MKEREVIYVTNRFMKDGLDRNILYSNDIANSDSEIQTYLYIKTKNACCQYDYKLENLKYIRNKLAKIRREIQLASQKQTIIYTCHKRSFCYINIANVKVLRRRVKRVPSLGIHEKACENSKLSSCLIRRGKRYKDQYYTKNKRALSKCVGFKFNGKYKLGCVMNEKSSTGRTTYGINSPNMCISKDMETKNHVNIVNQKNAVPREDTIDEIGVEKRIIVNDKIYRKDNQIYNASSVEIINNIKESKTSHRSSQFICDNDNLSKVYIQNSDNFEKTSNLKEEAQFKTFSLKETEFKKAKIGGRYISQNKIPSGLKYKFKAIRRGLSKKKEQKSSDINDEISNKVKISKTKCDIFKESDVSQLEEVQSSVFYHGTSLIKPNDSNFDTKTSNKYNEQKRSFTWPQNNAIPTEYQKVKVKFKLWRKKNNLKKHLYDNNSICDISKNSNKKDVCHFDTKEKERKNLFSPKKKSRDHEKDKEAPIQFNNSVTTGPFRETDSFIIPIGNVSSVGKLDTRTKAQKSAKHKKQYRKFPKVYRESVRASWLQKLLSYNLKSCNSIKVRYNDKTYTTHSNTIFELIDSVYNNRDIMLRSKSESIVGSFYIKNTQSLMQCSQFPIKMKYEIKQLNNKNTIARFIERTRNLLLNKSHSFAHKIDILCSQNFIKYTKQNRSDFIEVVKPTELILNSVAKYRSNSNSQKRFSNEEVCNVTNYETASDLNKTDHLNILRSENYNQNTIIVMVKVKNSNNLEAKTLENAIPPTIYREILVQGSHIFIPNRRDFIGLDIISQRDMPTHIQSDEIFDKVSCRYLEPHERCELIKNYSQDYHHPWTPPGIDLFSWCVSDSHLQCCSRRPKGSFCNRYEIKSCPNINGESSNVKSTFDKAHISSQVCAQLIAFGWFEKLKLPHKSSDNEELKMVSSAKDIDVTCIPTRIVPKDSIEVYKSRKTYAASNKSKWNVDTRSASSSCLELNNQYKVNSNDTKSCQHRKTCEGKHVSLPDCDEMRELRAKLKEDPLQPEGILSFKSTTPTACKKQERCKINPIPAHEPPSCRATCEQTSDPPCSNLETSCEEIIKKQCGGASSATCLPKNTPCKSLSCMPPNPCLAIPAPCQMVPSTCDLQQCCKTPPLCTATPPTFNPLPCFSWLPWPFQSESQPCDPSTCSTINPPRPCPLPSAMCPEISQACCEKPSPCEKDLGVTCEKPSPLDPEELKCSSSSEKISVGKSKEDICTNEEYSPCEENLPYEEMSPCDDLSFSEENSPCEELSPMACVKPSLTTCVKPTSAARKKSSDLSCKILLDQTCKKSKGKSCKIFLKPPYKKSPETPCKKSLDLPCNKVTNTHPKKVTDVTYQKSSDQTCKNPSESQCKTLLESQCKKSSAAPCKKSLTTPRKIGLPKLPRERYCKRYPCSHTFQGIKLNTVPSGADFIRQHTPDPCPYASEPCTLTSGPCPHTSKPCTRSKEPCPPVHNRCSHAKDQCPLTIESCSHEQERCSHSCPHALEPCSLAKELCSSAENPCNHKSVLSPDIAEPPDRQFHSTACPHTQPSCPYPFSFDRTQPPSSCSPYGSRCPKSGSKFFSVSSKCPHTLCPKEIYDDQNMRHKMKKYRQKQCCRETTNPCKNNCSTVLQPQRSKNQPYKTATPRCQYINQPNASTYDQFREIPANFKELYCSTKESVSPSKYYQEKYPEAPYKYSSVHPCPPHYCNHEEPPRSKVKHCNTPPCCQINVSDNISPPHKTLPCSACSTDDVNFPWPAKIQFSNQSSVSSLQLVGTAQDWNRCESNCTMKAKMTCESVSPSPKPDLKCEKKSCPNQNENKEEISNMVCPPLPRFDNPSCPPSLLCSPSSRHSFCKPKLTGVHIRVTPISKRTCGSECPAWDTLNQDDSLSFNSGEKITIRFKEETCNTEDISEGVNLKMQDENGITLYERKDYKKDYKKDYSPTYNRTNRLLGDFYKQSHVHRLATALPCQRDSEKDCSHETLRRRKTNAIEIQLILKVNKGNKCSENKLTNYELKNDDSNNGFEYLKSNTQNQNNQEVFKNENLDLNDKSNAKKDINICIIIKKIKSKRRRQRLAKRNNYNFDFSNQISEKFNSVSTGYFDAIPSNIMREFTTQRSNINLISSMENSETQKRQSKEIISELRTTQESDTIIPCHIKESVCSCVIGDRLSMSNDTKLQAKRSEISKKVSQYKLLLNDTDAKSVRLDVKRQENGTGKSEINTNLMYEEKENNGLEKRFKQKNYMLMTTDIESPNIILKMLENGTNMKQKLESIEIPKRVHTIIHKKQMLKRVFKKIHNARKSKTRMNKLRNILRVILTSDSSDANEIKERISINNSFKSNHLRVSNNSNYVMGHHIPFSDRDMKKKDICPTQNSDCSMISDVISKITLSQLGLMCDAAAEQLKMASCMCSMDNGCYCKPSIRTDRSVETCCSFGNCDYYEYECNDTGYVDVETQKSRKLANKLTSTKIFNKPSKPKLPINIYEEIDSRIATVPCTRQFYPRVKHVKGCEMRKTKINRHKTSNISDNNGVVLLSPKSTHLNSKLDRHKDVVYTKYCPVEPDILQSYETKKAVLEIYTERMIRNGSECLVAKLPKFISDTEKELCSNFNEGASNAFESVCKRDVVLMSING